MVYFRCTSSGSGKGNTVIVTCAEQFAGVAITIAKIGKSYTKVCPLSAPYVVKFYGVEAGTYTVSATVSGQTYSAEVVVQDVSCVLDYGFNWKTWVDTASQLDSTDYASLSEVLADEEAVRELFTEHACVDYMASVGASNADLETIIENDLCAKWINNRDYALDFLEANTVIKALMDEADKYGYGEWALMPQVPAMTSNNAPYGEVIYSSQNSSYPAYRAFNTDTGTSWGPSDANVPTYIGYHFVERVCINGVDIRPDANSSGRSVKDFKVQASNDGFVSDIHDLLIDEVPYGTTEETFHYEFDNNDKYSYYRVYITSKNNWSGGTSISIVQFYAWQPKGNVPKMTSNTAPYGEAASSGNFDTAYPWKAFDNDDSTVFQPTVGQSISGYYLAYNSVNPTMVKKAKIYARSNNNSYYYDCAIYGGNSLNSLTKISETFRIENTIGDVKEIAISENSYNKYHVLKIESSNASAAHINGGGQPCFTVYALQFYGRELKVSVPTMTSNTAPYGEAIADGWGDDSGNGPIFKAFDGNASTYWHAGGNEGNHWIGYSFNFKCSIKMFAISTRNLTAARIPKEIILEGSDDAIHWTPIKTVIPNQTVGYTAIQCFANDVANNYMSFRLLLVNQDTSTSYMDRYKDAYTVQFYGKDYSEKEFEVGTTKKWLYDHGVELVDLSIDTNNGATITKRNSDIYISKSNIDSVDGVYATQKIDYTNYSLLRAKVGNEVTYSSQNRSAVVEVIANAPHVYGSVTQLAVVNVSNSNVPNNIGVDVSSINQSASLEIAVIDAVKCTITEWWLE